MAIYNFNFSADIYKWNLTAKKWEYELIHTLGLDAGLLFTNEVGFRVLSL